MLRLRPRASPGDRFRSLLYRRNIRDRTLMALLQIAEPSATPAPRAHRRAVGIDLGTTNSLVATVRHGIPVVLPDAEGRPLLPSIVHYGGGALPPRHPAHGPLLPGPPHTDVPG